MIVKWTPQARLDYYQNIDYWYERNASYEYPLKIIQAVEFFESEIKKNPYFLAKYSAKLDLYRKDILDHRFVIFYKVIEEEQVIEIRFFRGAKQKPLG